MAILPTTSVACMLLLMAHLAAVHAAPQLQDTPYTEIVSQRHIYSPPVPTGWILANTPIKSVVALANGWVCVAGVSPWLLFTGAHCNVTLSLQPSASASDTVAPAVSSNSPLSFVAAVSNNASLLLLVNSTAAQIASCDLSAATCTVVASLPLPAIDMSCATAAAYSHATNAGVFLVWIGTPFGTTVYNVSSSAYQQVLNLPSVATAIAFTAMPARVVAVGSARDLRLYDADSMAFMASEWVTNIPQGWGGPIDDAITSMVFAPDGTLYVGNPTCLNVMYPNGSIVRISGVDGLPFGNITSLALDTRQGEWPPLATPRLWLGTAFGAILFDPSAPSDNDGLLWLSSSAVTLRQRWRYFNGGRYLPQIVPPMSGVLRSGVACVGNMTLILTEDGYSVFTAQSWTLQQKAEWFETILPRHDRLHLGLVADCSTPTYGLTADCRNTPCESNGLWTGIQLAAEVFRFVATQDDEALSASLHYASGMRLLINATGDAAFPARTVSSPAEPPPVGNGWHNSTVYPGWAWMGDTSSDSTTGHMLAYALYSALLLPSAPGADAVNTTDLLLKIVMGIVNNNFTLIDPSTGSATRWGRWDASSLNGNQSWCDERGVNSMQIIAFLTAGIALADLTSLEYAQLTHALAQLTSPGFGYSVNILNAKIEAPSDDNYSDDELTFLPYAVYCMTASAASSPPTLQAAVRASVQRTYEYAQAWRPDLWTVIAMGCNATGAAPWEKLAGDVFWNLATWPLELIDWPTVNSQRLDVVLNPEEDRDMVMGTESLFVLPANERLQLRWNADPYTLDGGSGYDETEPGAWLLPYWMARYQGWLQPAV